MEGEAACCVGFTGDGCGERGFKPEKKEESCMILGSAFSGVSLTVYISRLSVVRLIASDYRLWLHTGIVHFIQCTSTRTYVP